MLKNCYRLLVIVSIIIVGLAMTVDARNLKGKTRIEIAGGQWLNKDSHSNRFYYDYSEDEFITDGSVGSIGFSHWQKENMALTINYSVLDFQENDFIGNDGYIYTDRSMVHSLLFGFRLYPNQNNRHIAWHPYFSVAGGPFFGFTNAIRPGFNDTPLYRYNMRYAQSAMGVRLGGGIDIELSRKFMAGMNGGYNFVTDFNEEIGGLYNHSGGDIRFSLSLLIGGHR